MTDTIRILMCPPDHYDVDYVINPWMEGNIHKSSRDRAVEQWENLYKAIKEYAIVELVTPAKGWPDMVFTANAGLVLGDKAVVSRFYHPERQGEEPYFKDWFANNDFTVYELPKDLPFEGAGDALFDREGCWLWAGYGFRSELDSHSYLAEWLNTEVVSLRLIDERFYHLDTCFCPLSGGYLLYYPPAFDAYSNQIIEMRVPEEKRIIIEEPDAVNFACNSVNINNVVVMNKTSVELKQRLEKVGFTVVQTSLTEFLKAGGAAKCLTLRVNEPISEVCANIPVESRVVHLEGHLLDAGIMNQALDLIVETGGSFKVLNFNLGTERQSVSNADVRVSAPSHDVMEDIMTQLIELGALSKTEEVLNAKTEIVTMDGVSPDDFYVTTIYPTEVRIQDQWVKVENQRMDGAIAVDTSVVPITARCKLLRDLKVGDQVVVDVDGIRTTRKMESHEKRGTQEFTFMGAGVSSERRVELVVEQIAWELRKIKEQKGKVIVTAGPVVIHTGGGQHLSHLIRSGYVHGLLGGNAIAVHDMEQNLMGTSLGVDMKKGVPVRGGHRHHLKVINTIRRYGSIKKAVEAGFLTKGVMYECVKQNIPFSLAGSIRDDGPLPDTQMDLIKAQQEYATILEGTDMILMLSSMLHSIGVGNMTPAGVKMVCVDINPAVVTKLSDRGSVESVGVVTDVGLFLSLLIQQLEKLNSSVSLTI
jgi:lysine-ketoglutarate reductase/saccharopine dehydrogenase-like protein (TIGR00300 family)